MWQCVINGFINIFRYIFRIIALECSIRICTSFLNMSSVVYRLCVFRKVWNLIKKWRDARKKKCSKCDLYNEIERDSFWEMICVFFFGGGGDVIIVHKNTCCYIFFVIWIDCSERLSKLLWKVHAIEYDFRYKENFFFTKTKTKWYLQKWCR